MQGNKQVSKMPSKKSEIKALAKRYKVLNALDTWARKLAAGEDADLAACAQVHGITKRVLMKTLKEDSQLQDEIFGGMTVKARLGVTMAQEEALKCISDPNQSTQAKLAWAQFCAKLASIGSFGKQTAPSTVIVGLIPDLPANFINKDDVIDVTPTRIEDLEAE